MVKRASLLALLTLVLIGGLTGCTVGPVRSLPPGPDWSRGILLGECSVNDTVALCPGDGVTHLAWGRVSPQGDHIRYVRVDGEGRVLSACPLPLAVRSPHQLRLLPDGQGGLIITYLSGISEARRLYAAHLDGSGQVVAGPTAVSGEELAADEYTAVPSSAGADIFWSNKDRRTRGIYHLQLDTTGQVVAPSKLVAEGGISPDGQRAADGTLHLTWIFEPGYYEETVRYAPFDGEKRELDAPVQVGSFALNARSARFGPVLALSRDRVYIVWSWEHLASSSTTPAGEAQCRYVSFAFGQASTSSEQVLALPPNSRPRYRPAEGAFAYSQLAPGGGEASPLIYMPGAAPGQRDEAALALAFQTMTRNRSQVEIGVAYLSGGAIKGYQKAGASDSLSMRPVLAADGQNQLHLAWLRPVGVYRYQVYYASTSPAVRATLGRFGRDDIVAAAYGLTWTLVQGLSVLPIAFFWLFLPFIWVIFYYVLKADGELYRRGPRIALGIAIALYIFCKFFLMPANYMGAAPFLDRMSAAVADVYVVALPVTILAVAGVLSRVYAKRAETATLLLGYFVFAATDAVLTLLLYGPGIIG